MADVDSGRPVQIRLIRKGDAGRGVIGWKNYGSLWHGLCHTLANPNFGMAVLRVVIEKLARSSDSFPLTYDQPLIVQDPSSVVVIRQGDRVCLVRIFRPTGARPNLGRWSGYVKKLLEHGRMAKLVDGLGEFKWELPRGMAPADTDIIDHESEDDYAVRVAHLEASEEAGIELVDVRVIGKVNPDSGFFVHSQSVVEAWVGSRHEQRPEDMEFLGEVKFMSPEEVRQLVHRRELDDAWTLSALAVAGFHF